MKLKTLSLIAVFSTAQAGFSQGTFQNLNFESANLTPVLGNPLPSSAANVPVSYALPGWMVYYGSTEESSINYNAPSAGGVSVSLSGMGGGPAIDGNFSVLLQGGLAPAEAASITQMATIPAGSQTLLFDADSFGPFQFSIGNTIVPVIAIGSGSDYTEYAASISAWAGSPEQLTFSALPSANSYWLIDDISFSATPVPAPEPSILGLTAIGGLLFGTRKWLRRNNVRK